MTVYFAEGKGSLGVMKMDARVAVEDKSATQWDLEKAGPSKSCRATHGVHSIRTFLLTRHRRCRTTTTRKSMEQRYAGGDTTGLASADHHR